MASSGPNPAITANARVNSSKPPGLKMFRGQPLPDSAPANNKPTHKKKRARRARRQKAKNRVVADIGEEQKQRKNSKGKVRELDIFRKGDREEAMSRNQREFVTRMNKYRGVTSTSDEKSKAAGGNGSKVGQSAKFGPNSRSKSAGKKKEMGKVAELGAESVQDGRTGSVGNEHPVVDGAAKELDSKLVSHQKKFDGMQPGENFAQFAGRLRKESKQMILEIAKKGNHQREKKRAYYEKRKEAAIRRKKRRKGQRNENDSGDEGTDGEGFQEIAHLPGYWQEILKNNGRPISKKQRKRRERSMRDEVDEIAFGEQVERPPDISVLPVRRGRQNPSL